MTVDALARDEDGNYPNLDMERQPVGVHWHRDPVTGERVRVDVEATVRDAAGNVVRVSDLPTTP